MRWLDLKKCCKKQMESPEGCQGCPFFDTTDCYFIITTPRDWDFDLIEKLSLKLINQNTRRYETNQAGRRRSHPWHNKLDNGSKVTRRIDAGAV